MNRLHLILVAILDTAQQDGGLQQDHAEALFNALSEFLSEVPDDSVALFEQNVRCILNAEVP